MNKPIRNAPVSVTLPPSAVEDLTRRVDAGEGIDEVDAFEFLHDLKAEYKRRAEVLES